MNRKFWSYFLLFWVISYGIALVLPAYRDENGENTPGYTCLMLGYLLIEDNPVSFISWCSNVIILYLLFKVLIFKKTNKIDLVISFLTIVLSSLSLFRDVGTFKPYIAPPVWVLSFIVLSVSVWLKHKPISETLSK